MTSYKVLRDEAEHEEAATVDILEEAEEMAEEIIVEDEGHEAQKLVDKATPKIKPKFQQSKAQKLSDDEWKTKQKSMNLALRAYIDTCVQNGLINRGYLTIIRARYRWKKSGLKGLKIYDIFIYNQLMRGYSEKMNLLKIREIYEILREDSIKPNATTYITILDCLGKLINNSDARETNKIYNEDELDQAIKMVISEASKNYFSLNLLMDKAIFVNGERENVLLAIHRIIPNFQPNYENIELKYNNSLVNELNVNVKDYTYDPIAQIDEKCPGSEIMESKTGFTNQEIASWTQEQILNELNGEVSIKSCLEYPTPTAQVLQYRQRLDELHKRWRETIISSFNRNYNVLRAEDMRMRGGQSLLPYLRSLETEQYANIILSEIRRLTDGSESYSPYISQLYRCLGEKVEMRYHMEQKLKLGVLQKTSDIYEQYCDVMIAGNSSDNSRQCWQRLVHKSNESGPSVNFHSQSWNLPVKLAVGRFLYSIIIRDLKLDLQYLRTGKYSGEGIPAFFTLFRHQGRTVKEELKPHPMLMKLYRGSQQENITFAVDLVPMVCPPQPYWTVNNGGYLIARTELIRLPHNCYQQLEMVQTTPLQNLYPVLDALNQQQNVAWKINTDVLDVVLEVFRKGGSHKLDIPELPSNLEPPKSPNSKTLTNEQKFKFFREKLTHRKKQGEMFSLWCDAHYRLSLANHFRDRPFWLPLNLDFRGRAYSLPPHLSHLGNDLGRSLMVFQKKKKLGIDGLTWLKLHCINLTGLKKRDPIRERLLFAEEIMKEILDSADNPLDGNLWWSKSDEPWQTLAICKEIANAIRSGDPENFESSIPIHQDGTCNGLQHYAALGRDSIGAYSVNLAPADSPQDVYSDVLALVEIARQKDEENGIEVAKVIKNFIKRKVIKQTVMTTVYGVTRYGARLQIAKQLKDIEDFPSEWVWSASAYLANKTFDSIREMFTSTKEIQDWFFESARLISSVCNDNVEWTTPLGLPIVQPYSRTKVKINVKKMDENLIVDSNNNPNSLKQRNAFPPNYIHSLDACHMMLTSVNCEKKGLTFASVHDCYWTHASTVPEMSQICREQFVALHSEPLLEDLSNFFCQKYAFSKK